MQIPDPDAYPNTALTEEENEAICLECLNKFEPRWGFTCPKCDKRDLGVPETIYGV